MNLVYYNNHSPKVFLQKESLFQHDLYFLDDLRVLVPKTITKKTINPSNFFNIKCKLSLDSVCIVDRIYPNKGPVCIIDHVNKSGYNFLIGNTPIKSFSVFPDMSNIYKPIPGLKQVVVHTIGPKRFCRLKETGFLISESVGLVSTIWHYVNVGVYSKNNMVPFKILD
jgi:hypothetical protein